MKHTGGNYSTYLKNIDYDKYDWVFSKSKKSYWKVKRLADITASLVAMIVLLPISLIISLVIFIDDPHGSPIYRQTRVGRHGKPFTLYKFRTMVVNSDELLAQLKEKNESDGPAFKIKDDPRITRVGKFLRKTSLDELPQLINVLKGDMTVVGPRPALPSEVALYDEHQKMRLIVTPGLTCFWQVTPNRNDVTFDEWVDMDINYISQRTFWKDIKLILKTVKVMIRGEGR